jgi:hypothetical protein
MYLLRIVIPGMTHTQSSSFALVLLLTSLPGVQRVKILITYTVIGVLRDLEKISASV